MTDRKKPIPFDVFEIRVFADGYMLKVDKMRPRNAPRFKHTQADLDRRKRTSDKNWRLLHDCNFQSLQSVFDEIRQYPGVDS